MTEKLKNISITQNTILEGRAGCDRPTSERPPSRLPHFSDTLGVRERVHGSSPKIFSIICHLLDKLFQPISKCFKKLFPTKETSPLAPRPDHTNPNPLTNANPDSLIEMTFETKSTTPEELLSKDQFHSPNKAFLYERLTENRSTADLCALFTKYSLQDSNPVSKMTILKRDQLNVVRCEGAFVYPPSNEEQKHWTANFADSHLFGYAFTNLLAQDELQILEHPALYHLHLALRQDLQNQEKTTHILDQNEIALIENVLRLGNLDTTTPISTPQGDSRLPAGRSLYGNNFRLASHEDLISRLEKKEKPHASNIFAMAAPHIIGLKGQPYQKQLLEQLFYPSYTAFSAAKERSEDALCIIHTGNWGAGAFGNDPKAVALIQIAAAHLAGVDELRYYPMASAADFQEATEIFEVICTYFADSGNPMTVDAFLSQIEEKAAEFDLLYRTGNGT